MSSIANQTAFNGYNNITALSWSMAPQVDYTYTATEDCTILFVGVSGTYAAGARFAINGTDIASFSFDSTPQTKLAGENNPSDATVTEALKHNLRMLASSKPMVDLAKGETLTIKGNYMYSQTVNVKKLT